MRNEDEVLLAMSPSVMNPPAPAAPFPAECAVAFETPWLYSLLLLLLFPPPPSSSLTSIETIETRSSNLMTTIAVPTGTATGSELDVTSLRTRRPYGEGPTPLLLPLTPLLLLTMLISSEEAPAPLPPVAAEATSTPEGLKGVTVWSTPSSLTIVVVVSAPVPAPAPPTEEDEDEEEDCCCC